MSEFIIPMGSLPSITSLSDIKQGQGLQDALKNNIPFADYLQDALSNVAETTAASESGMEDLAFGATDDLHTGSIQAVKTSTAVSYATALISRAIASYNEIIRMQI